MRRHADGVILREFSNAAAKEKQLEGRDNLPYSDPRLSSLSCFYTSYCSFVMVATITLEDQSLSLHKRALFNTRLQVYLAGAEKRSTVSAGCRVLCLRMAAVWTADLAPLAPPRLWSYCH